MKVYSGHKNSANTGQPVPVSDFGVSVDKQTALINELSRLGEKLQVFRKNVL